MQLLQGISIGEVELIAFTGLNVSRRLPVGESSSDRYALRGKSHPIWPHTNGMADLMKEAFPSELGTKRTAFLKDVLVPAFEVDRFAEFRHSRIPPRMGGGLEFLRSTYFAVRVKSLRDVELFSRLRFITTSCCLTAT